MKAGVWKSFLSTCLHLASQIFYFFTRTTVGKLLVKYGIALMLLGYVLYKNWDGIVQVAQRHIQIKPLLLATGLYVTGLMISFMRWHYLVRAVGLPFSRYDAIRLGLVGFYFNTFLPGAIGGDVVKAYAIAKESTRRTLAVATVLIDRVIGLWALIWFVAIVGSGFWFFDNPIMQNASLRAIVSSTVIFVIVSMSIWIALGFISEDYATRLADQLSDKKGIRHSIGELWRACWMYRKRSKAVLLAMLVSLVAHAAWILVFHYSVMAFPPNDLAQAGTMAEHAIVVPVGMTVSAFVPLPGGIGVGEAAFGQLYEILGKPKVNGVVGCMSQRVITYSLGLIGYIIYLRMRRTVGEGSKDEETLTNSAELVPPVVGPVP